MKTKRGSDFILNQQKYLLWKVQITEEVSRKKMFECANFKRGTTGIPFRKGDTVHVKRMGKFLKGEPII